MKQNHIFKLVLSALFLTIGFVLPFLTGQIAQIGNMLLPMHLPVLLCGFVCGWPWGRGVGCVMPILRSLLFGMPVLMPTALAMAFEMAAYGAVAGLLYARLPKKPASVYIALIAAMVLGRVAWGVASVIIYSLFTANTFSLVMFWTGGFVRAWPGMVLQVVLVPLIVLALERAKLLPLRAARA